MTEVVHAEEPVCALGLHRCKWVALGVSIGVFMFWLVATLGRPWKLFEPGRITSNFFDAQAHSLLAGHFSVPTSVTMIEGFATGHGNQMYFGIVPALFRLPVAVFTHRFDSRLSLLSELVALVVLGVAAARLARKGEIAVAARREASEPVAPGFVYAVVPAAAILATQVLFLAAATWVYHEAVVWGLAGAVWGLDAALTWWQTRRPLHLVVATVAACIAVGSRPSSGVAPLLALGIFAAVLGWRRQWRAAAWSGGASVVTFASYSAVNVARFGQLWGAPFELQVASAQAPVQRAAIAATGGTLVSPQYMLSTVARYLDPWPGLMRPTRLFPFVGWGPTAKPVLSSSHMYIEPAGSLPLSAPVVLVLAIVGAFWFVRRRPTTEWWAVAAAALMSSMVTLSFWSISQRYLVDLLTITFVLAAPGMWVALDWWRSRPPLQRRSLSAAVLVVTALAMWAQAGLALWTRHFSYLPRPDEVAAFVHFQYSVDDSLFSGSAPGVHQVSLRGTPSTSDHVVIAGWCGGTYVRSGFGWTAMERQPGGGRRLVLVPPAATRAAMAAGAVVVASGDGWRLETRPTIYPHFVKFFYIAGPVVHASMGGVNVDSNLVLDIVADPLTTDVDVRRGTDAVLLLHGVAAADRLVAGAGWNQLKGGSPFCESLLRRGVSAR